MKSRAAAALMIAGALVVAADYPWQDREDHPHWGNVRAVPFVSPPVRPRDILENLLLGMPVGAAAAFVFERRLLGAGLSALCVSLAGEWTQIYSHTRFPSSTDVVCNVSGALVAATLARRLARATAHE